MKICIHSFFFFHVKIHNQRHKTSRLGWMWIVFWIPITFYLGFFAVSSNTWTLGGFVLSFLPKCFDYFNEFFHISPNCKRIIAKILSSITQHKNNGMLCYCSCSIITTDNRQAGHLSLIMGIHYVFILFCTCIY